MILTDKYTHRIEAPDIILCKCNYLIFEKHAKIYIGVKTASSISATSKAEFQLHKNETTSLLLALCKTQFQIEQRLNVRHDNLKLLETTRKKD